MELVRRVIPRGMPPPLPPLPLIFSTSKECVENMETCGKGFHMYAKKYRKQDNIRTSKKFYLVYKALGWETY